jgi:hypothetical protein
VQGKGQSDFYTPGGNRAGLTEKMGRNAMGQSAMLLMTSAQIVLFMIPKIVLTHYIQSVFHVYHKLIFFHLKK